MAADRTPQEHVSDQSGFEVCCHGESVSPTHSVELNRHPHSVEDLQIMLHAVESATARLHEALSHVHVQADEANRASTHLQERLHLSAHMLTALEEDISRMSAGSEGLIRRDAAARLALDAVDERLDQFQCQLDELETQFQRRVKKCLQNSLAEFESSIELGDDPATGDDEPATIDDGPTLRFHQWAKHA